MKTTFILILASASMSLTAYEKKQKCTFNLDDTSSTVIGLGDTLAKAQANALEKCVANRTTHFEQRRGHINEDRFAQFIDSCSMLSCEK